MTNVPVVSSDGFDLLIASNAFVAAAHAACWLIVDYEKGNRYWDGKPVTKVGDAHVLEGLLPQLTALSHSISDALTNSQANPSALDVNTLDKLIRDLKSAESWYIRKGGLEGARQISRSLQEDIDQNRFADPQILLKEALQCLERLATRRNSTRGW